MINQFIYGFMKKNRLKGETKQDIKRVIMKLQDTTLNGGIIGNYIKLGADYNKANEELLEQCKKEAHEMINDLNKTIATKNDEIALLQKQLIEAGEKNNELTNELKKIQEKLIAKSAKPVKKTTRKSAKSAK